MPIIYALFLAARYCAYFHKYVKMKALFFKMETEELKSSSAILHSNLQAPGLWFSIALFTFLFTIEWEAFPEVSLIAIPGWKLLSPSA